MSNPSSNQTLPSGVLAPQSNILYIHENQKGNPLINFIKHVKWQYTADMKVDYLMNTTAALFLSVRYHHRHPKYIVRRIEEVGQMYRIRILLILIDDQDQLQLLQELNRLAVISNFTLIFAWSNIEAARYLETFKTYENKSSQSIQSKEENEYLPKVHKLLSSHIKSVNKTDVITLLDVFQDVQHLFQAKEEELMLCPGIGEKKAKRLYSVFHEPFLKQTSAGSGKGPLVYEQARTTESSAVLEASLNREDEKGEDPTREEEVPLDLLNSQVKSGVKTAVPGAIEQEVPVSSTKSSESSNQVSGNNSRKRKMNVPEIIELDEDL